MKIIKLEAENIKRIVAVEIEPDGALVQITGRNGAGKSSVLDAIWWALAGERSVQSVPIRAGEDAARITLDLGDVVVTRHFTKREDDRVTTRITVENADGARFPSPQTMLDALLGSLSFDPLAFARASDRAQVEQLAGLCGVDLATVERAHKGDFERRRDCNRDAKQKRAAAGQIAVPADTPDEVVSVGDLVSDLREAEHVNRERATSRANRIGMKDELGQLEADAAEFEGRAAALRGAANEMARRIAEAPRVETDVDTSAIHQRITDAEQVNRHVVSAERKHVLTQEAVEAETKAKALTDSMDARRRTVADAIAEADLGIEGLTVQDGRVMLGAVPFEQASDSDRLRLSCAIAMRGDAKLRVLRVRDGSLLDADSLALLQQMAESADYQVWIEMVDTSGKVGIVIEDGRVKDAD